MQDTPAPNASPRVTAGHDWLIAYLRDHEMPCPRCGYCLRMNTTGICPECDHHVHVALSAGPGLDAWLTCLVSFTLLAGPGLIFLLTAVLSGSSLCYTSVVEIIPSLAIPVSLGLLLSRQRFAGCSPGTQSVWAWASVTSVAIAFFMLMSIFGYRY